MLAPTSRYRPLLAWPQIAVLLGALGLLGAFISLVVLELGTHGRYRIPATAAVQGIPTVALSELDPAPEDPRRAAPVALERALQLAQASHGQWDHVANTGSMEPTLTGADLAVVIPVDIRQIRVGDIIVFLAARLHDGPGAPPRRVVHRVIAKDLCGGGLYLPRLSKTAECVQLHTQGDANPQPDGLTTSLLNFEGRVAYRIQGTTGEVADLVASRTGTPIPFATALDREQRRGRLPGAR